MRKATWGLHSATVSQKSKWDQTQAQIQHMQQSWALHEEFICIIHLDTGNHIDQIQQFQKKKKKHMYSQCQGFASISKVLHTAPVSV